MADVTATRTGPTPRGLDYYLIDQMMRGAYTEGYGHGYEDGFRKGLESGRLDGESHADDRHRMLIEKVIGGRLSHVVRRLEERLDAPKSTIAVERGQMRYEARDVQAAIHDLEFWR